MKRSYVIVTACAALTLFSVACVDLFHGTDFETLCTRSPSDPACGDGDGGEDALADQHADQEADAAPTPHPDFCAWSAGVAHQHALDACAWLGACEHPSGESIFGSCVMRATLAYDCKANPSLRPVGAVDAFWGCLATVKSCGDVDRCVFPAGQQDCVAGGAPFEGCGANGNAAVRFECSGVAGRASAIEPCVMAGRTCTVESGVGVTCTGSLGFECTAPGCSGAAANECPSGTPTVDKGIDCAGYGAGACTGSTVPACVPGPEATKTCSRDATPACDGPVVTSCVNGKEIRIDCGALGLPCDVSSPVSPLDLAAACKKVGVGACLVADTCVVRLGESSVQSCGHGLTYTLSCADAGLGPCHVDTNGHAACTPPDP